MCQCWVRHQVLCSLVLCISVLLANTLLLHFAFIAVDLPTPPILRLTKSPIPSETRVRRGILDFWSDSTKERETNNNTVEVELVDIDEEEGEEDNKNVTSNLIQRIVDTTTPMTSTTTRSTSTTTSVTTTKSIPTLTYFNGDLLEPGERTNLSYAQSRSQPLPFWTSLDEALLGSVVGVAALVTTVLWFVVMHTAAGSRVPFFVSVCVSGVATLLSPFLITGLNQWSSVWPLFVARLFLGVSLGAVFPAVGAVIRVWASIRTRAQFLACSVLPLSFVPCITFVLCAVADSLQSPAVLLPVLFGVFTLIIGLIWLLLQRDRPQKHPFITGQELDRLLTGKGRFMFDRRPLSSDSPAPHCRILISPVVGSFVLTTFGRSLVWVWSVFTFPLILRRAMDYTPPDVGYFLAAAFFVQFVIAAILSSFAGRMSFYSTSNRARLFTLLGHLGVGLTLIVMALMSVLNISRQLQSQLLFLSVALLGVDAVGFWRAITGHARQWSAVVLVHVGLAFAAAFLCVPWLNYSMAWPFAQFAIAAILIVTAFWFCIFGSAEPAKWTESSLFDDQRRHTSENDNLSIEAGIIEMRVVEHSRAGQGPE